MDKSIVEMIAHWSNTAGIPVKTQFEIPSISRYVLSFNLIKEEFEELENAIVKNPLDVDYSELVDALGDLIWVSIRMLMEIGVDPNELISIIYESNMSKFDDNESDAILTFKKYFNEGVDTYSRKNNGYYITYRKSDNKVLKSHMFKLPDFSKLLNSNKDLKTKQNG